MSLREKVITERQINLFRDDQSVSNATTEQTVETLPFFGGRRKLDFTDVKV